MTTLDEHIERERVRTERNKSYLAVAEPNTLRAYYTDWKGVELQGPVVGTKGEAFDVIFPSVSLVPVSMDYRQAGLNIRPLKEPKIG